MMQAAETRAGSDAMSGGYAMYGQFRLLRRVIWKSKEVSMPRHECIAPHNRQELAPVDEVRKQDECDSRGVVRAGFCVMYQGG